ncbi:MAG: GBS Bsp-like repeat-containing protein [Atopobiaceae bacterium]|nr:GBS Bsp-like repeat-containing protein [Atopobiaceae bacterium]
MTNSTAENEKETKHMSPTDGPARAEGGNSNVSRVVIAVLWVALLALAAFLFRLVDWVFLNWGNLRMDELLYTMTADLTGTNPETIKGALAHTLPATFAVAAIAIALSHVLRKSPKRLGTFRRVTAAVAALTIAGSAFYFFHTIGLGEYIRNQFTESTFIEEHYADPNEVKVTFPERKRNLIFLFIESMEMSFSDEENGGGKPTNVIPELTELGLENETFSGDPTKLNGGYALYGATYTMGGMFAQTSGLPLTLSSDTLSITDGFIPGITALGDMLQQAGYRNCFLLGTDAAFGDRDKYFADHGDFEIWDYKYSIEKGEIPADYSRGWWGYDDAILYENAKRHLAELSASDEPFNLTMLTVDTHAEDGYVCDLCKNDFPGDRYSTAFACANRQAYNFVRWCQKQSFYENTTIVVVGDHCTMDHDYADDMAEGFDRRIYTTYINAAAERESDGQRLFCSMDNFPTVVAALGATIEGDRLGLGTNLFSDTPTLVEELGKDELDDQLALRSAFYDNVLGEEVNREVRASYDSESGHIDIDVLDGIDDSWSYDFVYCTVTNKKSGDFVQFALDELDGTYHTSVPMSEFDYEPGTYDVEIDFMMDDGLPKWFNTTSVDISRGDVAPKSSEGSAARSAEDIHVDLTRANGNGTFDARVVQEKSGPVLEISFKPEDGTTHDQMTFPAWSWSHSQDDLVWYQGELQRDGSYLIRLDLTKHGTWGIVEADIYSGTDGEEKLLGACVTNLS